MSNEQPRVAMTPALWISFIPALIAITGIVLSGFIVGPTIAVVGFFGLVLVGIFPSLVLIEMAQAELARGTSVGHFRRRWLVIAACFVGSLVGALALGAGLFPTGFVWVALLVVGTIPASVVAAILTVRSQRLRCEPYSGPLFEIKPR